MSHPISINVDEATWLRLQKASEETGRSIDFLAADGVFEYMLSGFRDRFDEDPAKHLKGQYPSWA